MKTVNVEISASSLYDIIETACKAYRQDLAEAEFFNNIQCIFESLADVIRLWEATDDNFDLDDELLLIIEKREEQEDGTDNADRD